QELSAQWAKEQGGADHGDHGTPDAPPVLEPPGNAEQFGILVVPRFGEGYARPILQGVGTRDVLNRGGVGHYPTTRRPGECGNFAVAWHRTSYGASFRNLDQLRVGDHLYVEVAEGWYSYAFRNLEYVRPTGVGVLNPVP